MKITNIIPPLHTVYNPIEFEFESSNNYEVITFEKIKYVEKEKVVIKSAELTLYFSGKAEKYKVKADVRSTVISLLSNDPEDQFYLYIVYRIKCGENDLGTYVAIRSVAQIAESSDLESQKDKLLTGFNCLNVWQTYPRKVSTLVFEKDNWLVVNKPIDCKTVVQVRPYAECALELTGWKDAL